MNNLDVWINVANVLYLASYSVRDILWLRMLSVTGALSLLPYYYLQPTPLMTPIYWNILFLAINAYWIIRLLLERRPVRFSPDEQRLYQLAFRTLTPREALQLFRIGTWGAAEAGETLARCGEEIDTLSIILSGGATAKAEGRVVAEIGEGQYVGQIAFLTENHVAVADVKTTEATRFMTWPREALQKATKNKPELGMAIRMALGVDVSRFLMKSWKSDTPA